VIGGSGDCSRLTYDNAVAVGANPTAGWRWQEVQRRGTAHAGARRWP
ncbi:uncharacterized protein METZ01_LOCUS92866, partial [marine metagenome]